MELLILFKSFALFHQKQKQYDETIKKPMQGKA